MPERETQNSHINHILRKLRNLARQWKRMHRSMTLSVEGTPIQLQSVLLQRQQGNWHLMNGWKRLVNRSLSCTSLKYSMHSCMCHLVLTTSKNCYCSAITLPIFKSYYQCQEHMRNMCCVCNILYMHIYHAI